MTQVRERADDPIIAPSGSGGLGGTSAAVGYSNGLSGGSNVSFQLPGSLVNGALINGGPNSLVGHDLNSAVLGRYDFQVRDGQVISGVPEPATFALLGLGLAGLPGSGGIAFAVNRLTVSNFTGPLSRGLFLWLRLKLRLSI
jgi:hypothetical protein